MAPVAKLQQGLVYLSTSVRNHSLDVQSMISITLVLPMQAVFRVNIVEGVRAAKVLVVRTTTLLPTVRTC